MCTAVNFNGYFGRNFDYDTSFGESIVITPRNFEINLRSGKKISSHKAFIGTAHIENGHPLYYDGMNENGLCAAALRFGEAKYNSPNDLSENIASFEFIYFVLAKYSNVDELLNDSNKFNITNKCFSNLLPSSPLHWMIGDKHKSIVAEQTKGSLDFFENKVHVLTNSPEFNVQTHFLNNFINLSPKSPKNEFGINLSKYSRGMGAIGLPGDLSSSSRFVKAAFVRANSKTSDDKIYNLSHFFHILDSVKQPYGCCEVENGKYEYTIYQNCMDMENAIYYFRTYKSLSASAVYLRREDLDGNKLTVFQIKDNMFITELN